MDRMKILEKKVNEDILDHPLEARSVNTITRPWQGTSYSAKKSVEVFDKLQNHPMFELQNLMDKLTNAVLKQNQDDVRYFMRLVITEARKILSEEGGDLPPFSVIAPLLNNCKELVAKACRDAKGESAKELFNTEFAIIHEKIEEELKTLWKSPEGKTKVKAYEEGKGEATAVGSQNPETSWYHSSPQSGASGFQPSQNYTDDSEDEPYNQSQHSTLSSIHTSLDPEESMPASLSHQLQATAISPATPSGISNDQAITSEKGQALLQQIREAYSWKQQFSEPTPEFLSRMDRLFMECQMHMTSLSSHPNARMSPFNQTEIDALCEELVAVRNHWGQEILPNSTCNAFVRERVYAKGADGRDYRIDCAQFFEPVPFYGNSADRNPGGLVKLNRFSVYDVEKNEVVNRYYHERSDVNQVYHVLCWAMDNKRGQIKPFGVDCPSYWDLRASMLANFKETHGPLT